VEAVEDGRAVERDDGDGFADLGLDELVSHARNDTLPP